MKTWNKNVFDQMDHNISELEHRLAFLEDSLQISDCETVEKELLTTKKEFDIWNKKKKRQYGLVR